MKNILTVSALLLLISGNALAGVEYDKCMSEEKGLKAEETDNCKGLRYLLNPSGCFATRKALQEYKDGKCKTIGKAEKVDFSAPKVVREKVKSAAKVDVTSCAITSSPAPLKKPEATVVKQDSALDQLKDDISRLTAEIIRLKEENELLRKLVANPDCYKR